MKAVSLFLFFFISCHCWCQKIEVMVPAQPVVLGTAFQVQYVIPHPSEFEEASTPAFDSCQIISGPNIYKGNAMIDGKLQPIQNIAYTLVPIKTGVLKIGAIHVKFKNRPDEESIDAGITVVQQPKASFNTRSSYTDVSLYKPSQKDRDKLINDNLFVKVDVNKNMCYVGEPLIATFTLYSRLQSSSEAEKSPAFYGFSVVDMLNMNEAHTAVKTINGKIFNTSILRQVQLYPVQAGQLTIDEMYIQNTIEFNDSLTKGKTQVEKEIITKPLTITVKPIPPEKPESFSGAVGQFTMQARLDRNEISVNGQGKLMISIKGQGNFIQFGSPLVQWPAGIEPFDPIVTDKLNKNISPINGEREYAYAFATDSVGNYILPPVTFSFFNVATGKYQQLSTDTFQFKVIRSKKRIVDFVKQKTSSPLMRFVLLLAMACIVVFVFYKIKNKKLYAKKVAPVLNPYTGQITSLGLKKLSSEQTCLELQSILYDFSKKYASQLSQQQAEELQLILKKCQLCIYSHTGDESIKKEVMARAFALVKSFT